MFRAEPLLAASTNAQHARVFLHVNTQKHVQVDRMT